MDSSPAGGHSAEYHSGDSLRVTIVARSISSKQPRGRAGLRRDAGVPLSRPARP